MQFGLSNTHTTALKINKQINKQFFFNFPKTGKAFLFPRNRQEWTLEQPDFKGSLTYIVTIRPASARVKKKGWRWSSDGRVSRHLPSMREVLVPSQHQIKTGIVTHAPKRSEVELFLH